MNHYVLVYSPDNEPFEVSEDKAASLVLNHGWTKQPTETADAIDVPPGAEQKPVPRKAVQKKSESLPD